MKTSKEIVEEKLKMWSSYLPYNLETAYCDRFGDILTVGSLNNIQYNESETHPLRLSIEGLYELEHEWMFKPFLWDMDMLTKEIEHKGERFIPLHKILEEYCFDLSKMDDREILSYAESLIEIDMTVTTYNLLLEWHFNVFNLEESEYIKKQPVIQK